MHLTPREVDKLLIFSAGELARKRRARGLKLNDIIHAVRVAVSGKAVGPGMFECLELLGKDRCERRIELAIARAQGET